LRFVEAIGAEVGRMFIAADKAEAAKTRLHCASVPVELESIATMSEGSFPDGGFLEFLIKTSGNLARSGARVFYDFQRF
jgi:hypothetical protein